MKRGRWVPVADGVILQLPAQDLAREILKTREIPCNRWTTNVLAHSESVWYVTTFALHTALKLSTWRQVDFRWKGRRKSFAGGGVVPVADGVIPQLPTQDVARLLSARQRRFEHILLRFRVQGSGFRVQGSGFRVQGSGFRVQGSGFRVQGSRFRVQGSGFRVQGLEA